MSTRIEYRAPDAACNPYLAFAVMLAAGLEGITVLSDLLPNVSSLDEAEAASMLRGGR